MKAQTARTRRPPRVTTGTPIGLAPAVLLLLLASPLSAQSAADAPLRENWTVSAVGGLLSYGPSDDERFPAFSLRADTHLYDYARFEVEAWYSRPDVQQNDQMEYDPSLPTKSANLFSFTLGVHFRHALGPFEPYAGAAAGLFARRDDDSDGQRFSRNTFYFPAGFRLWVSNNLGVRGEFRFRRDNHQLFTKTSREFSAGLLWTF